MSLLDLDSYPLHLITNYLSGEDITRLYLTGNDLLQSKLTTSVKRFTVNIRKYAVFPSIITKFELEHFEVTNEETTDSFHKIIYIDSQYLSLLPTTLKTLILDNNIEVFDEQVLKNLTDDPFNDYMILRQTSLPPVIDKLPSSLTHLDLKCKYLTFNTPLPSYLTHLDLRNNTTITDDYIHNLPKHLTHLNLTSNFVLTDSSIVHLPRGLKCLMIAANKKITDVGIRGLPPTLEVLYLDRANISDDGIAYLPKTLKELYIYYNNNITNIAIKNLPRGLKCFGYNGNGDVTVDALQNLPNLESLEFDVGGVLDEHLKLLPKGLTTLLLGVRGGGNITNDGLIHLPRNIKHLTLGCSVHITCVEHLPPNLTYLSMVDNQALGDGSISQLPRGLTHLDLYNNKNITDNGIQYLPSGLTHLDLGWNTNLTKECRKYLPQTLKFFSSHIT